MPGSQAFPFLRDVNIPTATPDGPRDGGAPWGNADLTNKTIMIPQRRPVKIVGGSYTVVDGDSGALIVVTGAGTITLPDATNTLRTGMMVTIKVGGAVAVVVSGAVTDQLAVRADLGADTVTYASEIGAGGDFICDGAGRWWHIHHLSATTAVGTDFTGIATFAT